MIVQPPSFINFKMQTLIFLQTAGNAGMIQMLFFAAIILVFWLFIIRPQAKRQKEQTAFSNEIEKGREVVTASGMLGRVNKVEGDIVTLEVGTKVYIRMTKSAISKELTEQIYGKEAKKGPVETQD
jgi:preprotein translocase subunit YajC